MSQIGLMMAAIMSQIGLMGLCQIGLMMVPGLGAARHPRGLAPAPLSP